MHTVDCENSNCVKCRQASEGQSSEEENQKILMTAKELVSEDLLLASDEKELCLETCNTVKYQIHFYIGALISILRERERDLIAQADKECCAQMTKIDCDATARCIDKLLKTNSEPEKTPCKTQLVFDWDHHPIIPQAKKFGRLFYVDTEGHVKKECQIINQETAKSETENEKLKNPSSSSNDVGQHFEEDTDSVPSKEVGKDVSSDEDDMEIISRSEAAAAPSESPALPPKRRFRFSRKRSSFASLFSKKPLLSRENSSASERSICSETKSQECVTASIHPGVCGAKELPSLNHRTSQESSGKCLTKSESSINLETELPSFNEPSSQETSSKCLAKSESSFVLKAESPSFNEPSGQETSGKCLAKSESAIIPEAESPSFNEPSSQESSSEYLGDSNTKCQGPDPSVTLQSSFTKYLEKNRDGEWLVSKKTSEQSASSGNSCIFSRDVPFVVDNLNQWLSTKTKQKVVSDWLYTARV